MSESENAIASIAALLSLSEPSTITASQGNNTTEKAIGSLCIDCVIPKGSLQTENAINAMEKLEALSDAISQAPSLKTLDTSPIQSLIEVLPQYMASADTTKELMDKLHTHLSPYFSTQKQTVDNTQITASNTDNRSYH
tara:strand:- start:395 stop:811 length:417 start_codon:yes stop_codon:yes gene_type:complete